MRLLVANGADSRLPTTDGTSAVSVAAGIGHHDIESRIPERQHLDAVKLTLELGGDINAANDTGFTPLHGAAFAGFDTVVQWLADHGADLNRTNKAGATALGIAEGNDLGGGQVRSSQYSGAPAEARCGVGRCPP